MTGPGTPVADRLRRIASVRLGRPLHVVADPTVAPRTAAPLGAVANPPITDAASLAVLADVLAGVVPDLPAELAERLTTGLGLPAGALDPAVDFARVECALLREFLDDSGVLDVRHCRGGDGPSALLHLLGVVTRGATRTGAT